MFRYAIVRTPSPSVVNGLTSLPTGKPDYRTTLLQHERYIEALKNLGLEIKVLCADYEHPDSTFIEDVALCTSSFAVITNPGAGTRKGEIRGMREVLSEFYENIEEITSPGTLEGGDVLKAGDHFYIGLSGRTNKPGADQLINILNMYGMEGTTVEVRNLLHLKTGISYLENNCILATGELGAMKEFRSFRRIIVDENEKYAANSLWINGTVLVPEGYHKTQDSLQKAGFKTLSLNVSEFRKIDGGLSCLSIRFGDQETN